MTPSKRSVVTSYVIGSPCLLFRFFIEVDSAHPTWDAAFTTLLTSDIYSKKLNSQNISQ